MPKAAAQRMSPAQISTAMRERTPVAVHRGFKRGFTMDASRALITDVNRVRTVFASAEDILGRDIKDGVAIRYLDGGDGGLEPDPSRYADVVGPADLLQVWDEYVVDRDKVLAHREAARSAAAADREELEQVAGQLGGSVMRSPAGVLGVFVPRCSAIELAASI